MPNDFLDDGIATLPAQVVLRDAAAAAARGDADTAPVPAGAMRSVPGVSGPVADATLAYQLSPEAAADRQRAAQQAAEERHAAAIDAKVQALLDEDVPDDTSLGIDTSTYGPRRGEFIRFTAWLNQLRQQRDTAEGGRTAYLAQLGVPAELEQRIESLLAGDKKAFGAWLRAGAAAALRPLLREQERADAETALHRSRHECEIAQAALAEIEDEISVLGRAIAGLEGKIASYAKNALVEVAGDADRQYQQARDSMRAAMVRLRAMEKVVGTGRAALRDLSSFSTAMPVMPPSLTLNEREIAAAAAPWRDRLQRLIADPRAEFSDDCESHGAAN